MLEFRLEIASYRLEVGGAGLLHLDLDGAVPGIDIVELLLPAQARVLLHLGVEVLVDVEGQAAEAEVEPQVVEGGILVGMEPLLADVAAQGVGAQQQ